MANIRVVREGGETRDEIVWQAQELDIHERPNGPAVAAIIAAAIGVFVLGLQITGDLTSLLAVILLGTAIFLGIGFCLGSIGGLDFFLMGDAYQRTRTNFPLALADSPS